MAGTRALALFLSVIIAVTVTVTARYNGADMHDETTLYRRVTAATSCGMA